MLRQLTPHGQAMHANFIVSVCANQWAMFTVEQRWDEEYITLLSRPMAVADTAAAARIKWKGVRKPNPRRKEKLDEQW